MRALLTITGKDLRQRLRDRSAYLYGLVVPLGLALLFGLIVPGFEDEELSLTVGVVDLDGGQVADQFRSSLGSVGAIEEVAELPDTVTAERAVDEGELDAAYVLPEGFSEVGPRARTARLDVVVRVDDALPRHVAISIAEGFAQRRNTVAVALAMVASVSDGLEPDAVGHTSQVVARRPPAITLEQGTAGDDPLDITTYLAAGMAVFFLFFTVQFGVLSLLEERENGTLDRLRAAPIGRRAILGAKVLTSVAMGLVSMTVLVLATTVLLDARWGDPAGVAVLVVSGVLAASAIVAVVGALARTAEQASTWQAIIAIVLGMLGGSFFPLSDAPGWLEPLRRLSPHHWFLDGLGQLAGGGGPTEALPATGALLAFTGAAGVLAAFLLPRG